MCVSEEADIATDVSDVSDEQNLKARSPMCVSEAGIATDVSDEQSSKAFLPMCVSEAGIATDVSDEQP
eukprot:SAG31_NODE_10339_length_1152_cov_3.223172_4_plen_68_part_00